MEANQFAVIYIVLYYPQKICKKICRENFNGGGRGWTASLCHAQPACENVFTKIEF